MELNSKRMTLETILHSIIPHGIKETVMCVVDTSGITAWVLMSVGTLHALDAKLEAAIKILTLVSLLLTVIYKVRKLFK